MNTISEENQFQTVSVYKIKKLLQYLEENQHKGLRLAMDHLFADLKKAEKPGDDENPHIEEFEKLAAETRNEVIELIKMEERMIFPQIKALLEDVSEESRERDYHSLSLPVKNLIIRHHELLEKLNKLRQMVTTLGYEGFSDQAYRKAFSDLYEFYAFYEQQVYLEENLLFPALVRTFEFHR